MLKMPSSVVTEIRSADQTVPVTATLTGFSEAAGAGFEGSVDFSAGFSGAVELVSGFGSSLASVVASDSEEADSVAGASLRAMSVFLLSLQAASMSAAENAQMETLVI